MTEKMSQVKVAVVQASPVLFDREATVEKTCRLVQEAAGKGAKLVLFPEAFIPAYPRGLSFGTVVGSRTSTGRRVFQRYWENAVEVPGPNTDILGPGCQHLSGYRCD
jgi:nitrilase